MKGFIRFILIVLVLLIATPILILGYLGFIPKLSSVLGSDKPRNLGVVYTDSDLNSVVQKNGIEMSEMATSSAEPKNSIKYSGSKTVSVSLTSEEITALSNSPTWKYYPVSDIQIKLNSDGSGEASGILILDRLTGYLGAIGISPDVAQTAADYLKIKGSTPFYFKGIVSVQNNKVSLDTQKIEIGKLPIPVNLVKENQHYLAQLAEIRIDSVPGLSVKSFNLVGGRVNFEGTLPEKISWSK
ncbi:MAG: hypothetical protein WC841_00295 [Candidatus Shapirobacteria bacterium]|jgi:hypothetical protein